MKATSIYPVLMVENVRETAGFYERYFGFQETFSTHWYVSLCNENHELALLQFDHPTVPEADRALCRGMLINIEVADARAEHRRLVEEAGLAEALSLRDESFGQRHFIVRDPAGNLVDVIQNIPPGAEYEDHYSPPTKAT